MAFAAEDRTAHAVQLSTRQRNLRRGRSLLAISNGHLAGPALDGEAKHRTHLSRRHPQFPDGGAQLHGQQRKLEFQLPILKTVSLNMCRLFLLCLFAGLSAHAQVFKEYPLGDAAKPAGAIAAVSNAATATNNLSATNVPAVAYSADDKYKLRIGDRLSFQILEDRELPKPLLVMDSGEVDVPYIGRVLAQDKTCKQLSETIKAQLEQEYYKRATVIVAVDAANRLLGRVYVWGQVRSQGAIDMMVNDNLTVGKAILRAGGFADFANKKKVKLVRAPDANGKKETIELNMKEILEDGKTEKDVAVQPEDFILVPTRLLNY
ncbi:MAG: polysaccharide export protein [Verrucomicrobia bacterium]|nr:MAG: polysaccharide export protein [Verrucomicrobiota bacterium]